MSLRYLLFDIPSCEEEVVERARRTGEVPKVYVTRKMINSLDPVYRPFQYTIRLKIGGTKIPVDKWERSFPNFVLDIDRGRFDFVSADAEANKRARSIAEKLSLKGIPLLCGDDVFVSAI